MNADIPCIPVFVQRSFVSNDTGVEPGYAFAIQSYAGRALAFHVMLRSGAHYRGVPIHALHLRHMVVARPLGDCQFWDCFTFNPVVHVYNYLRDHEAECYLRSGHCSGTYLFTVDWLPDFRGPGLTHLPDQNKCGHVMALSDGNLACLPTNRIAWKDGYYIGQRPDPNLRNYKVQSEVYQAESSDWDVSRDERYFYGPSQPATAPTGQPSVGPYYP